jgi:tRNA-specific adenosine deaminase 1
MDSIYDRKLLANQVAQLCYNHFDNLPKKGKPIEGKEWTVVAAFVQQTRQNDETKSSLEVVSMGTGSKCVGQNKLSKDGDILNDSHAEVVARRGFLRYMYHQMEIAASGKESDLFIVDPISKKLLQREGVSFIFFSSHTPCGDASIIVKENSKIMSNTTEEILKSSEIKVTSFDEEPPSKMPRFDIPDIHRTGAKCVEGGPQVSKTLITLNFLSLISISIP